MKRNQLAMSAAVKLVAVMYLAAISPCHSSLFFDSSEIQSEEAILRLYAKWSSYFNVTRVESDPQKSERLKSFTRTVLSIRERPAALNSLADMTANEFNRLASCISDHPLPETDHDPAVFLNLNAAIVPATMDWRDEGAVLPVRNQGLYCGSCWAFSATDTISSICKINKIWDHLVPFSVQQLVDCDDYSCGCKHGTVHSAFHFVKSNGITSEQNYPYTMKNGECRGDKVNLRLKIEGYQMVPSNNESALQQAVSYQPVSATIDSTSDEFKRYTGGLYTGPCDEKKHSHQVTIVGYGSNYWIIKNSWGTGWGDKGYMMLPFGKCKIAKNAVFPIKKQALPY